MSYLKSGAWGEEQNMLTVVAVITMSVRMIYCHLGLFIA